MTPTGFVALRKAVGLAHATRGLRLRFTHRGAYLAEVGHDVVVRTSGTPLRFTPCQVRMALARALVDSIAGRSVSAFGLPVGDDPEIHFGVGGDDAAVLPFGIVRREVTTVALSGSPGDTRVLENLAYEMLLGCAAEELVDPAWTTTALT